MAVAGENAKDVWNWMKANFMKIAKQAVESGKTKLKDLGKAAISLGKKDHEDETGVDWDSLEIDTSTMSFGGLLLGKDSAKKVSAMEKALGQAVDKAKAKAKKREEKATAKAEKAKKKEEKKKSKKSDSSSEKDEAAGKEEAQKKGAK